MNDLQKLASQLLTGYGVEGNNGLDKVGTVEAYTVTTDNLVCPCCRAKLRLIDSTKQEFEDDDLVNVAESTKQNINENKIADYLLEIIEDAAQNIYKDELEVEEPTTDSMGNITDDYNERFLYMSDSLKKIVKTKANAIANMVKQNGIEVSPFYIENELFSALKSYAYK